MVQSPSWAANWFAASQEIPRISRNQKVHHRTHNRPPPVSILRQPNPVHIPTSHLLEIHPNIIHPSTPRSPQWSLSLRFPHQALTVIWFQICMLGQSFVFRRHLLLHWGRHRWNILAHQKISIFILLTEYNLCFYFNPLSLELEIHSLVRHLCKTWICYEPRRVTLGNTRHFVGE